MIDTPRILKIPAQSLAIIHLTIPKADIQKVMGPGIGEVMATLRAQGLTPAGRWLTHHFKIEPTAWDFEICVPVSAPVEPTGRVTNGLMPAATVARTIHHGGYEGLGRAWPELDAWIVAQGRTPAVELWETYLTDPSDSPDPAAWRTELTRPLVD